MHYTQRSSTRFTSYLAQCAKRQLISCCNLTSVVIASFVLTACGGGGDGTGSVLADAQGRWVSTTCEVDGERSQNEEILVNGTTAIQSLVIYVGSTVCGGDLTISTNLSSTISANGDLTPVTGGDAKNLDVTADRAFITGSDAILAVFASQGTTLQDQFTAQGIPDINNVALSGLVETTEMFTIYRVSGNELRLGESSFLNDGTSAALRHSVLGEEIYLRQ